MNKKALQADILLLLTAGIWGFGFVAQRSGMEYVGPFAFNGIRFILGSLSLLPIILVRRKRTAFSAEKPDPARSFLLPSLAAGSCLFIAVIFQQFGILFTTAGNAGFITGLYVILTPVLGIFLGRKTGPATWFASVLTLTGLYFISVSGHSGSINPGDVIIVISALFWTMHVLLIDRLMQAAGHGETAQSHGPIDPVELSAGQFAVCGFFSLLGAFFAEPYISQIIAGIDVSLLSAGLFAWRPFPELIMALRDGTALLSVEAVIPILYGGLGSVGIAYTLQVIAQRDAPPAHATIILCFEGCFAALGGMLLLGEKVGVRTLLGFIFMLAGMLTTQWEVTAKGRR